VNIQRHSHAQLFSAHHITVIMLQITRAHVTGTVEHIHQTTRQVT